MSAPKMIYPQALCISCDSKTQNCGQIISSGGHFASLLVSSTIGDVYPQIPARVIPTTIENLSQRSRAFEQLSTSSTCPITTTKLRTGFETSHRGLAQELPPAVSDWNDRPRHPQRELQKLFWVLIAYKKTRITATDQHSRNYKFVPRVR